MASMQGAQARVGYSDLLNMPEDGRRYRRHLVRPDAVTRDVPDVAVEVLSPTTAATDRGRKMQMFARYGVSEYWIVDPVIGCIEIRVLEAGAYRLAQVASREHRAVYPPAGPGVQGRPRLRDSLAGGQPRSPRDEAVQHAMTAARLPDAATSRPMSA